MEDFTKEIRGGILTNRVNLLRVTVNEAIELKSLLEEQIILGHDKIVIDLSQCTHLDSTFVGVLVVTQKKLLAKGGGLKIVEPLDPAKELMHITGVSNVLDTFETAEDAQKSFNGGLTPINVKSDAANKTSINWVFS